MPRKERNKQRKEMSDLYRNLANGGESFSDFNKRIKKLKNSGLF